MSLSLHEVIEYGPIVFSDDDLGVLIGCNGAYLNWFNQIGPGKYDNSTCRARNKDLYESTVADVIDEAKEWFDDEMNSDVDEE